MARLETRLTQYAAYHRDRRNILTHLAAVPMLVFAIVLALATVSIPLANLWALGLFVAGWALQLLGHRFEGVKPGERPLHVISGSGTP